jgi:hypothetical protein
MCFGSSQPKTVQPPPPTPPTTFDYNAGNRGGPGAYKAAQDAGTSYSAPASFGSELSGGGAGIPNGGQ